MFGIGVQELAIILVVALLIFGPKRLPELARTLGKGLAEFRRASSDLRQSINFDLESPPARPKPTAEDPTQERDPSTRPAQAGDVDSPNDELGEESEHQNDAQEAAADGGDTALPEGETPSVEEAAAERSPVTRGD